MRNYYNSCCDGEAVIGRIVYGNKYPFGTVSKETYTEDMERLNGTITDISDSLYDVNRRTTGLEQIVIAGDLAAHVSDNAAAIDDINADLSGVHSTLQNKAERSEVPLIQVLDAEPVDNNCIWFKPYNDTPEIEAMLYVNNTPDTSEIQSNIDGTDYGVDNATTSEDIPEGVYNFTIF